jgi:hypothetical protein
VNERPNFIALDTIAIEIAKIFALILQARCAHVSHELEHGVFGRICQAARCTNRIAFA